MPLCVACLPLAADSLVVLALMCGHSFLQQYCFKDLCGYSILGVMGVVLDGPSVILSEEEAHL